MGVRAQSQLQAWGLYRPLGLVRGAYSRTVRQKNNQKLMVTLKCISDSENLVWLQHL